jgi:hypothetical protein
MVGKMAAPKVERWAEPMVEDLAGRTVDRLVLQRAG